MGRTKKNIQLSIPENPSKIKGSRAGGYRIATVISSRSRYDHFDTSPLNISTSAPQKTGRTDGENKEKYSVKHSRKPQ